MPCPKLKPENKAQISFTHPSFTSQQTKQIKTRIEIGKSLPVVQRFHPVNTINFIMNFPLGYLETTVTDLGR